MNQRRFAVTLLCTFGIAAASGCIAAEAAAAPTAPTGFIEGRVTSADDAPEAGVWVIAETDALATPYRKIVVTDDRGRFLLPELPEAEYRVWVRGYGLADSAPQSAEPGDRLELTASTASAREAAAIYPASYWLSLMNPPQRSAAWTNHFKLGCQLCHQVGSLMTRTKNRKMLDVGLKKATYMDVTAHGLGRERLLDTLGDWSARIAGGETPPPPPRPQGVERNLVITQWAWGDGVTYAHDEIATDKRDPTRYPHGPIYGVDLGNDRLLMLDPTTHTASERAVPTRGGYDTPWCDLTYKPLGAEEAVPAGLGSLG